MPAKPVAALAESSPSKMNVPLSRKRKAPSSSSSAESTLEKVLEEDAAEPVVSGAVSGKENQPSPARKAVKAKAEEPKAKKKRKLLGGAAKGTLFGGEADAEDAEVPAAAPPPPPKAAVGPAKRVALAGPMGKKRPVALGFGSAAGRNAFAGGTAGGFSPLKRDKRGVNASFLA
jgi:hypothetical protein